MGWTGRLVVALVGGAMFAVITVVATDAGAGPALLGGVAFALAWIGAETLVQRMRTRSGSEATSRSAAPTDRRERERDDRHGPN